MKLKRLKCKCPIHCKYCGARRRRDSVGHYCPSAKLPIDRPCSACGDGDTEMKYHDHEPPFRSPRPRYPIPLNAHQLASIEIWAKDSGIPAVWGNEEVRRLNLTAFARKILDDVGAESQPASKEPEQ